MTRSMTGFGKASRAFGDGLLSVEVSAVNHRFLDYSIRLPNGWAPLEQVVKQTIKERASRGRFSVTLTRRQMRSAQQRVRFDAESARQYLVAAQELAQLLGTSERLSLNVLARLEGVFYCEDEEEDLDAVAPAVVELLHAALDRVDEMRTTEGRALATEVRGRIDALRAMLATAEERLPELRQLYEERLRARIAELTADASLADEFVAIEVAVMAEKGDVTEEVVYSFYSFDEIK